MKVGGLRHCNRAVPALDSILSISVAMIPSPCAHILPHWHRPPATVSNCRNSVLLACTALQDLVICDWHKHNYTNLDHAGMR